MATRPHISLVMIVRDEAEDLADLLAHHRGLWDEAVVVDTGSRDASAVVAAAAGAVVLHRAWDDDFAAARNHGLASATGEWALVLDCDEHIAQDDFPAVRRLAQAAPTGWVFGQRNYCADTVDPRWCPLPAADRQAPAGARGYVTVPTCRLFPLRPPVRYEGVVHEVPDRSLGEAGVPLRAAEVTIHHRGNMRPGAIMDRKKSLYGRLLRAKAQQDPEDPRVRYELAVQLTIEGHNPLAARLLERTVRDHPENPETLPARLLLARLRAQDGESHRVELEIAGALRRWPAELESWLGAVAVCRAAGLDAAAEKYRAEGARLFPLATALQDGPRPL